MNIFSKGLLKCMLFSLSILLYSNLHSQIDLITIENQTWVKQNLAVKTFNNGDPILHAKTNEQWFDASSKGIPAYCFYENSSACEAQGILYNWYAVNDPRGIVPKGYHIPSMEEIYELIEKVGEESAFKTKSEKNWEGLTRIYKIDDCSLKSENTPYEDYPATYYALLKKNTILPKKACVDKYTGGGNGKYNMEIEPFGRRFYNGAFDGQFLFSYELLYNLALELNLNNSGLWETNTDGSIKWKIRINSESQFEFKNEVFFWTSSADNDINAHYWGMEYREVEINKGPAPKGNGYLVKYLKD